MSTPQETLAEWRKWLFNSSPRPDSDLLKRIGEHLEAALARADTAECTAAAIRDVAGMSSPWPITEVLDCLADAADHLIHDHDCDLQHEKVSYATQQARQVLPALRVALSADTGNGYIKADELRPTRDLLVELDKLCQEISPCFVPRIRFEAERLTKLLT